MNELLGLPYSPWSEKARWALDVKRVPYRTRMYAPLVGEPALRMKLRKWTGPVSVPVLTTESGESIPDSAAIARWADAHPGTEGTPSLFPAGKEAELAHYIDLSERGLTAGRTLSLVRILNDRDAQREMVPKGVRSVLGPLAAPVGRMGIQRTLRKYGLASVAHEQSVRELTAVLDELRAAIATGAGEPRALLGAFSFADITMAQVLGFVKPPAFGLKIGVASRRNFTDEDFVARYGDVIAWRDAMYETYRPKTTAPRA